MALQWEFMHPLGCPAHPPASQPSFLSLQEPPTTLANTHAVEGMRGLGDLHLPVPKHPCSSTYSDCFVFFPDHVSP